MAGEQKQKKTHTTVKHKESCLLYEFDFYLLLFVCLFVILSVSLCLPTALLLLFFLLLKIHTKCKMKNPQV